MSVINKVQLGTGTYNISTSDLVACSTAAGTAAKTVTLDGFKLESGATIHVQFANANTATNPTLNVSSTGAKAIKKDNVALDVSWASGQIVTLTYDGTSWQIQGDVRVMSSGSSSSKPSSGVKGQIYFVV